MPDTIRELPENWWSLLITAPTEKQKRARRREPRQVYAAKTNLEG